MRYTLLALLLIGLCTGTAAAQIDSQMARADSLFDNYKEEQGLEAYEEVLQDNPKNLKALWRSSLLYSRVGNRFDEKDKEKEYFNLAKERAQQALDVDPNDTNANFVMAVAMGRMALILGAKERVAASRDIKKYADRSIEADSMNPGPWHVLGRWNYEIANLNFAERLAANVLFGGVPDGASTENAVKDISRAIELNPKFVLYYYDLAKAYEELGEDEKAIEAYKTCLGKPTLASDDEKVKEDCRELLDDLE